ncbi:MAG: hemolysin family protein [Actinomycetota bacterium]|nr:hemolysin family protein [Actinomycetota bacterium]
MLELVLGFAVLVLVTLLSIVQGHLQSVEDARSSAISIARTALLVLLAASWLALLSNEAPFAVVLAVVLLAIWLLQQLIGRSLGQKPFGAKLTERFGPFVRFWSKASTPLRLSIPEVVEEYEQELIESVEDFSETVVREVMVPRVDMEIVNADDSLESALAVFISTGYSRLPVIGEDVDDVVGVLYLKDLARYTHQDPGLLATTTSKEASRPALFTPDTISVAQLLRQMQKSGTQIAIVSDEYGGVAGIATIEDLLEEIVGEISDEHDRETEDIVLVGADLYRVNPRVTLDEISEQCEIEIEDEDVDTVGGLLIKGLGELPKGGEVVEIAGIELTAERVDAKRGRILSVLVRKLEQNDD